MRLYCPECNRKFQDLDLLVCPDDGSRLYSLAESKPDPLIGVVLDDRFRVDSPLNTGGMGAVYRATQLSVNREVAIKVLRPDMGAEEVFLERFFREARVIAELSHPNIVRLIEFGQDRKNEILYLAMELVPGGDMGALLKRGRLATALALEIAYQTCAGLSEPHSRGIVHRDLKPANLIILPTSDGSIQVKILDFGIARAQTTGTQLTQTGMICGTPSYMSPEQAQNQEIQAPSDLYSLGIILFEMLTGQLPFPGESGLQLLLDHVSRPAPILAEAFPGLVPDAISDLVAALLEKSPHDRPSTARAVRKRIRAIRAELAIEEIVLGESQATDPVERLESLLSPWIAAPADPFAATMEEQPFPTIPRGPSKESAEDWDTRPEPAEAAPSSELEPAAPSEEPPLPGSARAPLTGSVPSMGSNNGKIAALAGVAVILLLAIVGTFLAISTTKVDQDGDAALVLDLPPVDLPQTDEEPPETAEPGDGAPAAMAAAEDTDLAEPPARDQSDPVALAAPAIATPPTTDTPASAGGGGSPTTASPTTASTPPVVPPIPTTPPTADEVHEGSIQIESPAQAEQAATYAEITGDLVIRINIDGFTSVDLPHLTRLRGNLVIDSLTTVTRVSLPELTSIGGSVTVNQGPEGLRLNAPKLHTIGQNMMITSSRMSTLDLPQLTRVGAMIMISQNRNLTSIRLPALEEIETGFSLMENPALESLRAPALREIGEDLMIFSKTLRQVHMERLERVGGNVLFNEPEALESLRLNRLRSIGMTTSRPAGLMVSNAPQLRELNLSELRQVKSHVTLMQLPRLTRIDLGNLQEVGLQMSLNNNGAVQSIDLRSLRSVAGNLVINENPALTAVHLSPLDAVDNLVIIGNPRLSTCAMQSTAETMTGAGWAGELRSVNNLSEDCQ